MPKRIQAKAKTFKAEAAVGKRLNFQARSNLKAAVKGSTKPTITMIANTGKPMNLEGFPYPVIIDLKGAKYAKSVTPIIYDHDTSLRIGHTLKQGIIQAGATGRTPMGNMSGPLIFASGVPSSSMGVAQGFVQDAKNGYPFQVSVGADIDDAFLVDEGERSPEVNGKRWRGPLIVASKTTLAELTITVLGADRDTSATIAAARNSKRKEISAMNFNAWVKSLGLDPKKLTASQKKGLQAQYNEMKSLKAKAAKSGTATKTRTRKAPPAKKITARRPASDPSPRRIKASRQTDDDDDDDATLSLARRRRLEAKETNRIDRINACFLKFQDDVSLDDKVKYNGKQMTARTFKAKAIQDGLSSNDVELVMLRASMPGATKTAAGPAIHMAQQVRDLGNEVMACALVRQSGMVKAKAKHPWTGEEWGYEHWYPDKVLEASGHKALRNLSLHQLMDYTCIQANGYGFHGNRKSDDFINATRMALKKLDVQATGPTTMNLGTIFEDSGYKIMWAAFQGVEGTWQEVARVESVSDFKTHNMYRMSTTGAYKLIGVDGLLEHGGFTEEKYSHAADTYGKMVGLDRRHIINDDMGVFNRIMADLGAESAKSMEELVWLLLLGSLTTLFPTDNSNKNYISGADSTISVEGLTKMTAQWGNQVDADNSAMMIPAVKMIVGWNNLIPARNLFQKSSFVIPPGSSLTEKQFIDNPFVGQYPVVATPFINNTAIKQRVSKINAGAAIPGQTQTGWFLAADPNNPAGASIIVSLLNGNRLPTLQSSDAAFDMLGLQWRGFHDFGVDLGDYRFMAFSKGAT
jgi:hypothetical protein